MTDIREAFRGIIYGLWYSRHHVVHSFVIIPTGILTILAILYGFNVLLSDVAHVKFPSSVLCMLVNLTVLITLNLLSNLSEKSGADKRTLKSSVSGIASRALEYYLMIIRPPMNFSLKWINVFFIPSFIILPLSDSIGIIEVLKIAAVFLIGGVSLMILDVYMIFGLKQLIYRLGFHNSDTDKIFMETPNEDNHSKAAQSLGDVQSFQQSYILARDDITTIDLCSLRQTHNPPNSETHDQSPLGRDSNSISENILYPDPSKRDFNIPDPSGLLEQHIDRESSYVNETPFHVDLTQNSSSQTHTSIEMLTGPAKTIAVFVTSYIDWFFYGTLFIVALPFYYIGTFHVMLPFHLALTVISYYLALLLLDTFPNSRKFAHPILVSTAEILFVCFISSLIYHHGSPKGFLDDLKYYKTGKNYLNLFDGKYYYNNGEMIPQPEVGFTSQPSWPGCGDFLSSLMDISIVSLSLPMFTHRKDFLKNFWLLVPPLFISVALTFFCYPLICYHIGISSERSLGFIGRSVTLALGTPLISSLGGSISLMAVCTILSGICGVLIGDTFFNLLNVPLNDYVTRGVTLGTNCGAIATAHLLNSDPRAASMSSLSFSVFGTIMIVLASIGAIRDLLQGWVNL